MTVNTAVILQGDSERHLINSSYLLGTLIAEMGTKDVHVCAFYKDNKKQIEDILIHFKIDPKNITYIDNAKAVKLLDKVKEIAPFCVKNQIHVIAMPNTPKDLTESPQEISELVNLHAITACQQATSEYVDKQKPKEEKERNKLLEDHKVSPFFKFGFMDDEYIYNNRDIFGLKKFFPDPKPEQ